MMEDALFLFWSQVSLYGNNLRLVVFNEFSQSFRRNVLGL